MGSMKDILGDDLFDPDRGAFARASDPQTSHAAAARTEHHVTWLQEQVLAAIRSCGDRGANWNEQVEITGIRRDKISPRWKDLRKKGMIEARVDQVSGKIIKRDNQTVWFAK